MSKKSHFHMKELAPRLALRKRLKVIRKWPIDVFSANQTAEIVACILLIKL